MLLPSCYIGCSGSYNLLTSLGTDMNVSPVVPGGIDTNQLVISNEPVDSASTVDVNAVILPTGKCTLRANCDVYHTHSIRLFCFDSFGGHRGLFSFGCYRVESFILNQYTTTLKYAKADEYCGKVTLFVVCHLRDCLQSLVK